MSAGEARLRFYLVVADRFISFVVWGVAAGMIVWSMLNSTPYVAAQLAPEWRRTAFVPPLVADLAFVGALRLDEVETEEAAKADAARAVREQEAERRRRQEQEEAARRADRDRAEADRVRQQQWEDQKRATDLEEQREAARAACTLDSRRLDLEERRITTPVPAAHGNGDGTTGHRPYGTTRMCACRASPGGSGPSGPHWSPERPPCRVPGRPPHDSRRRTRQRPEPTPAVPTAQPAPARVTARVDEHQEQSEPPAGPVKDWDLPGLPETCVPGRAPELLTDAQVTARIDYGLAQEWTQRQIGEFAGRSATVVNRRKKERDRAV